MSRLDLALSEIEYTDKILCEAYTDEELLDYLIDNPNEISNLETDDRYADSIGKFKEGGLL